MIPHPPPSSSASPVRRFVVLGVVALALGLVYAFVLRGTRSSEGEPSVLAAAPESPETFHDVADFALVDSAGKPFTLNDLKARPSIVGFVFTRCTGPCPRITGNMRRIQDMLNGVDARLVTITVDPEFDTPAVLADYARNVGADTNRWTFLTGPLADVVKLSERSFLLPMVRDDSQPVGSSVTHRTWLTVVDRAGRIRGYYDGEGDAGVERAVARAKFLASEK